MQKNNVLAFMILQMFLVLHDFKLSEDWDAQDPNCRRDSGSHRIYTMCGRTLETIDTVTLSAQLEQYLSLINKALYTRFHSYQLEAYLNPCGFGSSVYISIYF